MEQMMLLLNKEGTNYFSEPFQYVEIFGKLKIYNMLEKI